jgi:hypothetical protein
MLSELVSWQIFLMSPCGWCMPVEVVEAVVERDQPEGTR